MAVISCEKNVNPPEVADQEFSVRDLGTREALIRAIRHKPTSGRCTNQPMSRLGG